MKKPVHFYCELYKENFYFLQSDSVTDAQEYRIEEIEDSGQHGYCFEVDGDEDEGIFIWVREKGYQGLGGLVHECIHAANFVFKSRGVITTTGNDETMAYYVEWIFENCVKHIIRGKK